MLKKSLKLIRTYNLSILEHLQLDEALLRNTNYNYVIFNSSPSPAVVLGLSKQVDKLVHTNMTIKDNIQLIQRFTGGGTVFIDNNTYVVSMICNTDDLINDETNDLINKLPLPIQPFPRQIMSWTGQFYSSVFNNTKHPEGKFNMTENDYCFGNKKFGGKAQCITKKRFCHHTSFLWNYNDNISKYLKLPTKIPEYRTNRDHNDFLCPMHLAYLHREKVSHNHFYSDFTSTLENYFNVEDTGIEYAKPYLAIEHISNNKILIPYIDYK